MRARTLVLALALAAPGCALHSRPAPIAPDLVMVRPEVLAFLADAQATMSLEYVGCLEGGQIGRTLVIDGFRPAAARTRLPAEGGATLTRGPP